MSTDERECGFPQPHGRGTGGTEPLFYGVMIERDGISALLAEDASYAVVFSPIECPQGAWRALLDELRRCGLSADAETVDGYPVEEVDGLWVSILTG